jgi:hypothetical protein
LLVSRGRRGVRTSGNTSVGVRVGVWYSIEVAFGLFILNHAEENLYLIGRVYSVYLSDGMEKGISSMTCEKSQRLPFM